MNKDYLLIGIASLIAVSLLVVILKLNKLNHSQWPEVIEEKV